jgi:NADPH-dependent 2,4-dienoyl-CoA reductase/sulfur reductase-like enzyme
LIDHWYPFVRLCFLGCVRSARHLIHLPRDSLMHSTHEPRIAVVGAGLGGLACARVLQLDDLIPPEGA